MSRPAADTIPEDRVASILARAAELDRSRRETVSVDAIRTAALEAGISPDSVDRALEEYAAGSTLPASRTETAEPPRQRAPRFARVRDLLRRMRGPLKLGALAFVVGLSGAAGEAAIVIGLGAWLVVSGILIVKRRPARTARGFILRTVVMTLALGLGFAAGEVDEDAIAALFLLAAPLLVAGTLLIKVRLPRRFRSGVHRLGAPAA